jgi:hypothetical protein
MPETTASSRKYLKRKIGSSKWPKASDPVRVSLALPVGSPSDHRPGNLL